MFILSSNPPVENQVSHSISCHRTLCQLSPEELETRGYIPFRLHISPNLFRPFTLFLTNLHIRREVFLELLDSLWVDDIREHFPCAADAILLVVFQFFAFSLPDMPVAELLYRPKAKPPSLRLPDKIHSRS